MLACIPQVLVTGTILQMEVAQLDGKTKQCIALYQYLALLSNFQSFNIFHLFKEIVVVSFKIISSLTLSFSNVVDKLLIENLM